MAGLRQCTRQFARRKPAIQRWRTRPWLLKLDVDLDRRRMAEQSRTAPQLCFGEARRLMMLLFLGANFIKLERPALN
ncbi:hypothetical protein CR51_22065 [Caballeronia megalochromosomata]|nr:hypothetical protein CR51_22065 [Caballeronia megalochromosomata]